MSNFDNSTNKPQKQANLEQLTLEDFSPHVDLVNFITNLSSGPLADRKSIARHLFKVPHPILLRTATMIAIDTTRDKKLKQHEEREQVAQLVLAAMTGTGELITTKDNIYWFDEYQKRVLPIDSDEFKAFIYEALEVNASDAEWDYTIEAIKAQAIQRGKKAQVYSLSHFKDGKLYISKFDGNMYQLDGENVELLPNGSNDIFFADNPNWQPYFVPLPLTGAPCGPQDDEFDRYLLSPTNFATDILDSKSQRLLWEVWILSIFFKSELPTRPLLLFLGEKGSGKTTAYRALLQWIFGKGVDVRTLVKEKEDAFIAAVTHSPVVCCDNVDGKIRWLPDHLAALATGADITLRKLYKTNIEETYHPDTLVALNSRTPEFKRDDVVDRLLLLRLQRLNRFIPEHRFIEDIEFWRNEIWDCVFERLQRIIRTLNTSSQKLEGNYRMADFAEFGWKVAIALEKGGNFLGIMDSLEQGKAKFVLENDAIYQTLEVWLAISENNSREITTKELYEELSMVAHENEIDWPYEDNKVISFGKRLANILPYLGVLCEARVREEHARIKVYSFNTLKGDDGDG